MAVFTQSEVADIVGMPKSLLKNWTVGRPLKIAPSERPARGKGSPNIYRREDVYMIALAFELSQAGLELEKVDEVLAYLRINLPKPSPAAAPDLRKVAWLSIELQGQQLAIDIVLAGEGLPDPYFNTINTEGIEQIIFVKYIVRVMTLVQTIDKRIVQHEESMQQ